MAAEALYNFNAKLFGASLTPGDISSSVGHYPSGPIDPEILTYGNRFATRFTPNEAEKFAQEWTVVDHLSNTKTGFRSFPICAIVRPVRLLH